MAEDLIEKIKAYSLGYNLAKDEFRNFERTEEYIIDRSRNLILRIFLYITAIATALNILRYFSQSPILWFIISVILFVDLGMISKILYHSYKAQNFVKRNIFAPHAIVSMIVGDKDKDNGIKTELDFYNSMFYFYHEYGIELEEIIIDRTLNSNKAFICELKLLFFMIGSFIITMILLFFKF